MTFQVRSVCCANNVGKCENHYCTQLGGDTGVSKQTIGILDAANGH